MYDIEFGNVRFRHGVRGKLVQNGNRIDVLFSYHAKLKDEIKQLTDARWHGFDDNPRKVWSVKDNQHNRFQLNYLIGKNPYAPYDIDLKKFDLIINRPRYNHQYDFTNFMLNRRHCIIAAEMGTGKTLAAIEALEYVYKKFGWGSIFWIGTRSSLESVRLEFGKWNSLIWPTFFTYEGLSKELTNWISGVKPPRVVIFDECHRAKTPTAKRTQSAQALADAIRAEYGRDSLIILMSGSPAPNNPSDWFSICEIACPGFLKEGDIFKFKQRLCLTRKEEGYAGGLYNQFITWWDDERKCKECGEFRNHMNHDVMYCTEAFYHTFKPSTNEISLLYKRMNGLVHVAFKKDLLDLPEKVYQRKYCKPSKSVLNAAMLIKKSAKSTIEAITLWRELSDGFQYKKEKSKTQVTICPVCNGMKESIEYYDLSQYQEDVHKGIKNPPLRYVTPEEISTLRRIEYNEEGVQVNVGPVIEIGEHKVQCYKCEGKGEIPAIERVTVQVDCPKDDALKELLELYEDEGRTVIFAGFRASVDRCIRLCLESNWNVIRLDGRGWWSTISGNPGQLISYFQEPLNNKDHVIKRIAFVMQCGVSEGLNLTASSNAIYYSNTYKWNERVQSEDRIHRPGADHNRGCTIWDLIHLPTDEWMLDGLIKKRALERMSLGSTDEYFQRAMEEKEELPKKLVDV